MFPELYVLTFSIITYLLNHVHDFYQILFKKKVMHVLN